MTTPKLTAVLYTPNAHKAAVGVLVTQHEGEEILAIVEVNQQKNSNVYEYRFEGGISNGITRMDAAEMWEIAADNYGAMLIPTDNKFMNEHFKEFMKPYLTAAKEARKVERELKAEKQANSPEGTHITR